MRSSSPTLGSRITLSYLAGAAFLSACDSQPPVPRPPITATPTISVTTDRIYHPSINITRSDYDAALSKWKAQGILEYEITTEEVSLRSTNGYPETYRVNGDYITILRAFWYPKPTPLTLYKSDFLALAEGDNTVEGLFTLADYALNDAAQRTNIDMQTVYDFQFDPTFGYVTSFHTHCEERTSSASTTAHNCPTDTSVEIQVSQFKVLRSSRPAITPTSTP